MAVTSVDDVAALLGTDLSSDALSLARVAALIDLAEARIVAEVPGLTLAETSVTATLRGTCEDSLVLPSVPVTAIASVTVDGQTIDPITYRWHRNGELLRLRGYGWAGDGWRGDGWGYDQSTVVVSYTAGPVGAEVRLIVAELVRGAFVNPGNLVSETIGQRSATFATDTPGMVLSDSQRQELRRYRSPLRSQRMQVR